MPTPFDALFDSVRDISAADAAERLNIKLRKNSEHAVALCPLHSEDTPSMTFFPDGHFFCFGCHESGRAIELYQKVLRLSALEAARALATDFNIIEPSAYAPVKRWGPTAYDLKHALDAFKGKRWGALCKHKHIFREMADIFAALLGPDTCAESGSFWAAVQGAASSEDELCRLDSARPAELLEMARGAHELH